MANNKNWCFSKNISNDQLLHVRDGFSRKKRRTSSSSSTTSGVVFPAVLSLIFLAMADVNYKNAQEYLSDVRQEHARLEALVHPTGTNRRKRQATAKKKTLAVEHLEAINELLESVGEWDDDELSMVGTKYLPEGNDEEENLARPEANNDWCNHDQCHLYH